MKSNPAAAPATVKRPVLTRAKTANRFGREDTLWKNLTQIPNKSANPNKQILSPYDSSLIEKENQAALADIENIRRLLKKSSNFSMKGLTKALMYDDYNYTSACPQIPKEYLLMSNPLLKKKKGRKLHKKVRKA